MSWFLGEYGAKRVLVVEANEQVRQLIIEQMKQWGYAAVGVGTSLAAIEMVAQEGAEFHQIIVGYGLSPLNGLELASSLRQGDTPAAAARILILSGGPGAEEVAQQAMKIGAGFLRKPYEAAELRSAIVY